LSDGQTPSDRTTKQLQENQENKQTTEKHSKQILQLGYLKQVAQNK